MNITETLRSEIAALISGNHLYDTYYKRWKYLLESYIGGEEYRRAQNLVRYQLENNSEYQQRLNNTPLENHCASVISVYNSFLFRQEPTREYGSIENAPELKDFLRDCDFEGKSINQFMKDVSTWSSVFGHCWVFVTKPNIGAQNRAEEIQAGVRPYLSIINPIMVLDWDFRRQISGRYELVYIKYLEDINGDVRTVKKWYPDRIETTVVDLKKNETLDEQVVPNGLGKIPCVLAYNKHSTFRGIGISDISDIADAQRFIYNSTSEVQQAIAMDSHPSLVKTTETNAGVGPGSLIEMPDNLDPGLKPYALEFSGGNIDSIYKSIEHTISAIDKMANVGAVRATEAKTMSGVAMETEFQLLNAKLSEKADNLELAEEQMWKLWCEYQGYEWTGTIDYPGSFNIKDTATEINQLKTAKEAATSPKLIQHIDKSIAEWLEVEDYEEGEYDTYQTHQMIGPNGERVTVSTEEQHNQLMSQGYTMESE
jgi:hypothetical protein